MIFFSPFFDLLWKTKIFNKLFNIKISAKKINKSNLLNITKNKCKELNNSEIKYHSIIFSPKEKDDINMIKELNIDLSKLKNLIL